ncbi:hypothetical protein BH18ACI4_BH18ACI4_28540 [soil metagenome]
MVLIASHMQVNGGGSSASRQKGVEKFERLTSFTGRASLDKRVNGVRIALEGGVSPMILLIRRKLPCHTRVSAEQENFSLADYLRKP